MSQDNVERIKAGFAAHSIRLIYAENQKTLSGYDVVPVELIDAGDKVVAVAQAVGAGPVREEALEAAGLSE